MKKQEINFVFFGTPELAVIVLEELRAADLLPKAVVTAKDRPAGRGMKLTPPPVKSWAEINDIPVLQPEKLNELDLQPTTYNLQQWDVFVVMAYGKILPQEILDIPERGVLNIHPSLLPHHRGPAPIEAQILADDPDDVGVTVMLLDEKMDHGPIIKNETFKTGHKTWPPKATALGEQLARAGGKMLAEILPKWAASTVEAVPQAHDKATYCDLVKKEDAELETVNGLPENTRENFLKIRAFDNNPHAFFFDANNKRIIVTDADWTDNTLRIKKVLPEGKKEVDYRTFDN